MAPRIKVTGVLSCDPSWRGLAFILHVPSFEYSRSFLYDLKEFDKSKQYKHPARTTNIIQKVYDEMFDQEPRMFLVDKVIMESQHKPNMQALSWLLIANLLPRLSKVSTEYVSPLAWKAHFAIALTGSHQGNKDAAEEFVEISKNRLVASETVTDHNTADACLLLNSYLETTKNQLLNNIEDWSMEAEVGTKLFCPKCKNTKPTGVVRYCDDNTKKNYGKHFLTCWGMVGYGTENEKRCGNFKVLYPNPPKIVNGFIDKTWKVDDGSGPAEPTESTGQKRSLPPAPKTEQPPVKKIAAAPPPKPQAGSSMPVDIHTMSSLIMKHMQGVVTAINSKIDASKEEIIQVLREQSASLDNINVVRSILEGAQANYEHQDNTEQQPEDLSQIPNGTTLVDAIELDEIETNYS